MFSTLFARLKANRHSCCAAITESWEGSHFPLNSSGNVMQQGHMMISSWKLILNSVLFHFNHFFPASLYSLLMMNSLPLQLWSLLCGLLFQNNKDSCLFPNTQTLFLAPLNNSVLMETFNIACWGPLGAFDGLLLKISIYESWSDGTKGRKGWLWCK